MKIGIYGGSFNPVHNGHMHLAETALKEFELDMIFFVPCRISPHRFDGDYVSGKDRLEMLRLACGDNPKFQVSGYELENERTSYSIYTVEYFKKKFPDDELYLLVGSDMLLYFEKWYRFEDILKNVTLAVVSRTDGDRDILLEKAEKLGEYGRITIGKSAPLMVSSTEIRKKIAKNENCSCYLDKNVVQYIRMGNLYR
ncbi:MAG: nicotinate (nicotinamide) nucleotide adenylyltransferase [Ruminococcus sp.]|nr:nicotinate (nicotinamide) nucleotide adenylyltransferase [Ruminococcus sp.]